MAGALLPFAFCIACRLLTVVAHSWLDCADWDTATQTCRGYARNWHSNPAVPFGTDVGRDNRPAMDVPAGLLCNEKERINDPVEDGYSQTYPMTWVEPGQALVWRWPAKNHADVGAQRGVQLFISSGPGLGDDFSHIKSKSEWVNQYPNLQRTFSNCYLDGQKVGSGVDKAMCYGTFEIPADLTEGIYTFMWWWEFNAGEFYNSCADVVVGPVGGTRPTPVPTPLMALTPTPTPSLGGNCGSTWSQCGGNGWSGSTCCTTGNTCHRYHDYYSQCIPGSPQIPVPTPVPTPMPVPTPETPVPTPVPTSMSTLTTTLTSSMSSTTSLEPSCELHAQIMDCVLNGGLFACSPCANGIEETCCSCQGGETYSVTTTSTTTSTMTLAKTTGTTTTTSTTSSCKPWCASNTNMKKCKWQACSGCPECSTRRLRGSDGLLV